MKTKSIHSLKSWPPFFRAIVQGDRTHELRRNDREFRVGDMLELHEFDNETGEFTGAICSAMVTSLTSEDQPCAASDLGLRPGFCILSIKVRSWTEGPLPRGVDLH